MKFSTQTRKTNNELHNISCDMLLNFNVSVINILYIKIEQVQTYQVLQCYVLNQLPTVSHFLHYPLLEVSKKVVADIHETQAVHMCFFPS